MHYVSYNELTIKPYLLRIIKSGMTVRISFTRMKTGLFQSFTFYGGKMPKIEIVSVKQEFFKICTDHELLHNDKLKRPYLIILKLKYKNRCMDFAIPFRSNIPPNAKEWEFYSLPPNHTTKETYHHGLHFIKMFPIKKEYKEKFHTSKNIFFQQIIEAKIKKDLKLIVGKAQNYLVRYGKKNIHEHSVDIDKIIEILGL